MKKILVYGAFLASLVSFFSCAESLMEDTFLCEEDDASLNVRSDIRTEEKEFEVTPEMAFLFASSFMDKHDIVSVETYGYGEIPCLYIINYERGWMVIPTDTRVQTVLGDSDVDDMCPESIDNDGVIAWLDVTAEYVYRVKKGYINVYDEKNIQLWEQIRNCIREGGDPVRFYKPTDADWVRYTTVSTNTVTAANQPHLLQTKWGQGDPWKISLPYDPVIYQNSNQERRFLTGCVPTAIAQILYYFHNETGYPNDFYYYLNGYVSQDLGYWSGYHHYKIDVNRSPQTPVSNSFRWSNMPLTSNGSGNFSYVSDLMMEIGDRIDATYSVNATSAQMISYTDAAPCGITANSSNYSYTTVRNNIVNRKPVIVTAFNDDGGHTWVIDGCVDITTTTTTTSTYYRYQEGEMYDPGAVFLTDEEVLSLYPNAYDGMVIVSYNVVENKYLLMNWGWNGNYDDGHYSISPSGSDWQSFTNNIYTIYNIVTGQLN